GRRAARLEPAARHRRRRRGDLACVDGGHEMRIAAPALALLFSLPGIAMDVQGHRGTRGNLPENTLPAFERALELGVDTLELDCGVTKDGVVVIAHDPALNRDFARDAGGRWLEGATPAIHDLNYAELARHDVGRLKPGTEYAKRFPRQQPV